MDVIKSSRFWIAIVILILMGIALVMGKVTGGETIAAALGILGGFGVAKTNKMGEGGPPPSMLALIFIPFMFCACAGTFTDQLNTAHKVVAEIGQQFKDKFHLACVMAAEKCKLEKDTTCLSWIECDAMREKTINAVIAADEAIKALNNGVEAVKKFGVLDDE